MGCDWKKVSLGRSGVQVCPLGVASSFGVGGKDLERAFERGVNYFYWGSMRTGPFGDGLRPIFQKDRAGAVLVVQSYTRTACLMQWSLERALRYLKTDYTDFLLLGWWNTTPPKRILDAALELKAKGLARHLMISCHYRTQFPLYAQDLSYDALMVRYNAAHPGAERDVFPQVKELGTNPGFVSYTNTCWARLLDKEWVPEGEKIPRAADCYRFALSNPNFHVATAGPRNGNDLDEAMSALDQGPLTPDEDAWMRRVGAAIAAKEKARGPAPIDVGDKVINVISKMKLPGD